MTDIRANFTSILEEVRAVLAQVDPERVDAFLGLIMEKPGVFAIGAGRSGLMIRAFAMRLGHLGLPVHLPGDILAPPIRPEHLLVVASGSGETGNLVTMARKAKDQCASIALITANPASTIGRMADCVVTLTAPSPKVERSPAVASAQPMGSLFEQSLLIFLEAVVMDLMRATKQDSAALFRRHANLE